MPKPSLRRNLLALVGLYACSLVVAAGCPTATPTAPPATASKAATSAGSSAVEPAAKDEATSDAPATSAADAKPAENAADSGANVAADMPGDAAQTATDDPNVTQVAAIDPATDKPAAKGAAGHPLRKPALDPVTVNGKYFEGWKKPKVALVFTGRQDGYLEPCGCAGLENQKGGLSRRHELFKQLRKQGWNLVPLDAGGLVRRFGKQAEMQFSTAVEALKKNDKATRSLGYAAVGFGANDLRLSAGEVAAVVAPNPPEESLFVSANVNVLGLGEQLAPRFRIIETGGVKIGVTSILGEQFAKEVNNPEVEIEPAAKALAKVMPELEDCDVKILLSNATTEESIALAKQFPKLDYVVLGGGVEGDPPAEAKVVEGTNVKLIDVAHKAMFAIVIGLFDDPKQPVRYQRVALDSRFKDSDEMKALMTNYQERLESQGWSGLGLKPAPHPRSSKSDKLLGKFIGSESCKDCHQEAFDVWAASKHAHATETLVDLVPPRQYDPECISCHATGWNAQDFFPYVSGFDSLKNTPQLVGNGCENCHGPGAAHVSAENGGDEALQKKLRQLMKYATAQAEDSRQENSCYKCHDHDNSPEFKFESYWKEIAH